MHLLKANLEELETLSQMSPLQLEKAWKWLDGPLMEPPPKELRSLSQIQWFLLDSLLQQTLEEKAYSRVQ
jgi:hypothetical protein